ncbi:MAG TPA: hypothetical protein VKV29_11920 [Chthonomonas sp.]|nr:hypothetical protein [Chthonomonas sp.]HLH80975.1 hypothetical protein [Chthonomonas sp.]
MKRVEAAHRQCAASFCEVEVVHLCRGADQRRGLRLLQGTTWQNPIFSLCSSPPEN